ncbi:MAG: hypothetical protein FWF34_03130 [Alphaproteobacteria bacterium]|nr:hypothetical protein [Alphaproteobacteria bacterium]MCL2890224.1 hypothetical protein [Alphaproteobacteria bacterium]
MTKVLHKILLICIAGVMTCSVAHADDYDFAFDSFDFAAPAAFDFGGAPPFSFDDDNIPDAFIMDAPETEMAMPTQMFLNPGAEYLGVKNKDIAGIFLGMPFEDVRTLFFRARSLYTPRTNNAIIFSVPRDWKYNLDYECRGQRIVAPAELEKCINSLARARGLLYASEMRLIRESTGETIDVFFTSNTTHNRVWRVVYKNDANVLEGDATRFAAQRDRKILAFWQGVLDKYGPPNAGTDAWISSDNAFDPMLRAFYGQLELTDAGLNAMDAADNATRAREQFRAKPYAF